MIACSASIAPRLLPGQKVRWCVTVAAAALLAAGGARANTKFQAQAAHPAPHFGGAPGGGAHMPGGMGGAHMPGNMGGAHMPSSMGAHVPGSMGGAHVPGGMGRQEEGARRQEGEHGMSSHAESHAHAEPHHSQEASHHEEHGAAHGGGQREARAGEHGGEHAGEHGGEHAAGRGGEHGGEKGGEHGDPRIGGRASMHTRLAAGAAVGAGAALAAHHFAGGGFGHDAGHDFRARPAGRDVGHDRAFAEAHAHDFHARYVRDFSKAEFGKWRGGVWSAGWHFGRFGWWWDVDGVWYPYAVPIYPFPLEVSAITVYGDDYVEVPALAAEVAIPPLPAAPSAVYSCAAPTGYYPAVAACSQPWQMADTAPALMPN